MKSEDAALIKGICLPTIRHVDILMKTPPTNREFQCFSTQVRAWSETSSKQRNPHLKCTPSTRGSVTSSAATFDEFLHNMATVDFSPLPFFSPTAGFLCNQYEQVERLQQEESVSALLLIKDRRGGKKRGKPILQRWRFCQLWRPYLHLHSCWLHNTSSHMLPPTYFNFIGAELYLQTEEILWNQYSGLS